MRRRRGVITALDGTNVRQEEVTSATRVKLVVVVGPRTTATEMGTLAFAAHSLFGAHAQWWRRSSPS